MSGWLQETTERWGEPRLAYVDATVNTDTYGRVKRTVWAWFPEGKNHGVHIDRTRGGHYVITAWSHARSTRAELSTPVEPHDDMIRTLTALAGWPSTS